VRSKEAVKIKNYGLGRYIYNKLSNSAWSHISTAGILIKFDISEYYKSEKAISFFPLIDIVEISFIKLHYTKKPAEIMSILPVLF
jgi:hypothetical protein